MRIRACIEKHQPDPGIAGHIHEGKGVDTISRTTVINPGMFRHGGWIDIRINTSRMDAILQ